MKVMIVKEVMTGDVLPVTMFSSSEMTKAVISLQLHWLIGLVNSIENNINIMLLILI